MSQESQNIEKIVTERLDKEINELDPSISIRLKQQRQQILHQDNNSFISWPAWSVPAGAVLASSLSAIVIAYLLLAGNGELEQIDSFEMMLAEEQLELYEELDLYDQLGFYEWLAEETSMLKEQDQS